MYYTRFDTIFCEIILVGDENGISNLHLNTGEGKRIFEIDDEWILNDDFFAPVRKQIEEYVNGDRRTFDVKLNPKGTDYQKKVWRELTEIPYGNLCTYKQIAASTGDEKASRAVGMANSKNPIPLIVPCHRVVGSNGKLTGFAHGLGIKEKLIELENGEKTEAAEAGKRPDINVDKKVEKTVREEIFELADEDYRKFQIKLCPNTENIVGVRLPLLRKLAQRIARGDWRKYMETANGEYFEELMLQGMVIGSAKGDIEEVLGYVAGFIPKIDNWAVCDSFCGSLKITNKNRERVWEFIQHYLHSKEEFEIRFAVVMLIGYYIDEYYIDRVLKLLDGVRHDGYYVKMAVAWAVSICFIKFPEKTMEYLEYSNLDNFSYNKSLQKITESLRVDKETKQIIRSMKRK